MLSCPFPGELDPVTTSGFHFQGPVKTHDIPIQSQLQHLQEEYGILGHAYQNQYYHLMPEPGRSLGVDPSPLHSIQKLPVGVKIQWYLDNVEMYGNPQGNTLRETDGRTDLQISGLRQVSTRPEPMRPEPSQRWNPFQSVNIGPAVSPPWGSEEDIVFTIDKTESSFAAANFGPNFGAMGDKRGLFRKTHATAGLPKSPASTSGVSSGPAREFDYQRLMLQRSYQTWCQYAPYNDDICWIPSE